MRSPIPAPVRKIAGRVSWTVVDQVLSALSNFLLSVLVARTVTADVFGAFSMAFLIFTFLIGVTRALIGQPLQITYASAEPAAFRLATRSALGAAVLLGLACGALCIAVGIALGGELSVALIVLGACLPGLLAQDISRMAFFARGRPAAAAGIDALWALLLFPALLIGQFLGVAGIGWPLAFWGLSALVAAVVGIVLLGSGPRLPGAARWGWQQRPLTGYLLAEYVMTAGVGQLGVLAVALTGDAAGVGSLRAAQVLLGPLGILVAASFLFAIPEISRRPDISPGALTKLGLTMVTAMGSVTAVYCIVVLLLPDGVGRALLGDTWSGAQSVLLPMSVTAFFAALGTAPASVLYGLGLARRTFAIQLWKAPLLIVLLAIAIPVWGAVGAAWAIAITEIVTLPLWLLRARAAVRERRTTAATAPSEAETSTAE